MGSTTGSASACKPGSAPNGAWIRRVYTQARADPIPRRVIPHERSPSQALSSRTSEASVGIYFAYSVASVCGAARSRSRQALASLASAG